MAQFGLSCLFLLSGCDREAVVGPAVGPSFAVIADAPQLNGRIPDFPPLPEQSAPIFIGGPDAPERPWDGGVEALIAAIEATGGQVTIGLKAPATRRSSETGMLASISRDEAAQGQAAIEALGAVVLQRLAPLPVLVASVPPSAVTAIARHPFVDYIEPIVQGRPQSQDTTWGAVKVKAPQGWSNWYEGSGAHVTIIDSGLDYDHYYSGDVDLLRLQDCVYHSLFDDCWDEIGHGTHMYGIIAGKDNSVGYVGIAHKANVSVVKACENEFSCSDAMIATALAWAVSKGYSRHIVNMSFALPENTTTLSAAISSAYSNGLLLIAAGGNTDEWSYTPYPAAYSNVVAVSGTLENDSFASWVTCAHEYDDDTLGGSLSSSSNELSAPFKAWSMWPDGLYEHGCGTSQAAAYVSGVAAVAWAYHSSLSRDQIRTRLRGTAVDLGTPGKDNNFGYGRVDVMRAVEGTPITAEIEGSNHVPEEASCQWQSDVTGGTPPYTYTWGGVLSGSASTITGEVDSSGYLYLTVHDTFGNYGFGQMYIEVGFGGGCVE